MARDPRDQFAALGATALFDALVEKLEESGALGEGDRAEILARAIRKLRTGGEASKLAAGYLESAFNYRPPQEPAPPPARPRRLQR